MLPYEIALGSWHPPYPIMLRCSSLHYTFYTFPYMFRLYHLLFVLMFILPSFS
ncbi:hypothetical protein CoNPh27_CDS0060 [Staphylococcus phage S-CoN_Ph27]|uniref:Uncharacterized protein n=1 Tax=Staphylococcus phage HS13 TaxID=3056403 RepID=A0AA50A719_9VIRU|nr:MAG: hypothetical protein [Staphylococcus phage HS13]WNM55326.1 hypothetical protein CoNPh27_CDS0060 [Staphylococcus phage S-CoN_Ph27]